MLPSQLQKTKEVVIFCKLHCSVILALYVGQSRQDKAKTNTLSESKDSSIHPSWEASRRRKVLENCQQSFKGKHVTFDDSD